MTKLAKNANLTSRFFLSPKGDEILMIVKANDSSIYFLLKLIQKKLFLRLCTRLVPILRAPFGNGWRVALINLYLST